MNNPSFADRVAPQGQPSAPDASKAPAPYVSNWRNPFVWLVVGLPGSAVVASLITVVIAFVNADEIVQAKEPPRQIRGGVDPMLPALKARNRAAEASAP